MVRTMMILALLGMETYAPAQTAAPRIRVGPDVRVSHSSTSPRVEMQMAANPTNARNLLATAIVTDLDGDHCAVYASFDGGSTWREHTFADFPETGSGDPQVAFGPDGRAYFTALGLVRGADGRNHFVVLISRSDDGGESWTRPVALGSGYAPDHEQLVVVQDGARAGRVYLSASHRTAIDEDNIGLFTWDGEHDVVGPLHVASGAGTGLFSLNPLVLSDGTLFVPALVSEQKPLAERRAPTAEIAFALSSDGGYTFSALKTIRTQTLDPRYDVGSPYASVVFAADPGGRFRDRVYMLWGEAARGHYHLELSYSADRGQTWSTARTIGDPADDTNQFRPAIAVSRTGVVGVAWLDTRASHAARSYDEFFTASVDGGATFLPPARVSSVSSALDVAGNLVLRPTIDSPGRTRDAVTFSFITTQASFRDGGDYLGLTADAAGVFHPLWADTRVGSFQAWTSAIAIDTADQIDADRVRAINSSNVSDKVRPLFDPARYDASTGVEEIPVSWQNISTDTLCGPIIAHVRRLSGGRTAADRAELLNGEPDPQGGVASFDYSRGSAARCLAPGEATRSIVWRARPAAHADTFVSFETTVTARVAPAR